jgi:Trk-type K+ transport system membrane component
LLFLSALWCFFIITNFAILLGLEWNNTLAGLDSGQKIAAAVFTVCANRTAGLNVLAVGSYHGAYLVFDMVIFVISSNPNAIAMRATRTQNEKTVENYTKELLINIVSGLTLCWFLILLIEYTNPWVQSPFPTLFEIASAFGTVGLSMGFGSSNASLSGAYSTPSKLVIMILMLIGSWRSLPENVDPVVHVKKIPTAPHVIDVEIRPGRHFFSKTKLTFFTPRVQI